MASTYRYVTLVIGSNLGGNLGPNFNLTTNVGVVEPSTATKEELIAGKIVRIDDTATQVTIISVGTCVASITQTIDCNIPSFFTIEYWAELYGTEWTVYAESLMGQASLSQDIEISGNLLVAVQGGTSGYDSFPFTLTIPAGQGTDNTGPLMNNATPNFDYVFNSLVFDPENLTNVTGTPNVTNYIIRYLIRQI